MKIDEALYQLKQNIKMHEIEGTTSNQNEREKALYDYITNLQETKINMEQELQELYLIKDNLQEENKRLHTRIKTIKRRRKAQTAKMRKYREEITNKQNSIVNYKSRNEKANEYIKEHTNNFVEYLDVYETKELSNILEGDKDGNDFINK